MYNDRKAALKEIREERRRLNYMRQTLREQEHEIKLGMDDDRRAAIIAEIEKQVKLLGEPDTTVFDFSSNRFRSCHRTGSDEVGTWLTAADEYTQAMRRVTMAKMEILSCLYCNKFTVQDLERMGITIDIRDSDKKPFDNHRKTV